MTLNPTQAKNLATMQGAMKNAFAANYDLLEPYIADDFVIYEAEGLPFGGVFRGIKGYVKCMKGIASFWSGNSITPPDFVPVGDDRMVMISEFQGTITHNGQHVVMPTVSLWDFKDGKIAVVRPFFFDTKKVADLAAL